MGWFKNMFKPKPGGTFLGNLIRKVVPSRVPQESDFYKGQYDPRGEKRAADMAKGGGIAGGLGLNSVAGSNPSSPKRDFLSKAKEFIAKPFVWGSALVVAGLVLVYKLISKPKRRRRRR